MYTARDLFFSYGISKSRKDFFLTAYSTISLFETHKDFSKWKKLILNIFLILHIVQITAQSYFPICSP